MDLSPTVRFRMLLPADLSSQAWGPAVSHPQSAGVVPPLVLTVPAQGELSPQRATGTPRAPFLSQYIPVP